MSIYLKDNAKDIEITQLQKKFNLTPQTKSINFITKGRSGRKIHKRYWRRFLEFLGYNPLLNSIDINFNSNYVNTSSLEKEKRNRVNRFC